MELNLNCEQVNIQWKRGCAKNYGEYHFRIGSKAEPVTIMYHSPSKFINMCNSLNWESFFNLCHIEEMTLKKYSYFQSHFGKDQQEMYTVFFTSDVQRQGRNHCTLKHPSELILDEEMGFAIFVSDEEIKMFDLSCIVSIEVANQ